MEKKISKIVHLILAVLALAAFLFLPIYRLGDKEMAGVHIIEHMRDDTAPQLLFVIAPGVAMLLTAANKYWRGVISCLICLCPLLLKGSTGYAADYVSLGIGSIIYMLLGVIMAVVAFTAQNNPELAPPAANGAVNPAIGVTDASARQNQTQKISVEVRGYDETRLTDILSNKELYNADCVATCEKELQMRKDAAMFQSSVEQKSDEELREYVANAASYNPALVYCSEIELKKRDEAYKAEQARISAERAEERRLQMEQAAKERKERMTALWRKWRLPLLLLIMIIAAVVVFCWWTSDGNRHKQGMDCYDNEKYAEAIEYFKKIDDVNSDLYSSARYYAGLSMLAQGDSVGAAGQFKQSVVNENWDCPEAYHNYIYYLLYGDLQPTIEKDIKKACDLWVKSPVDTIQMRGASFYFNEGYYKEANETFDKLGTGTPFDSQIQGYKGIMHLYGWGGLERDADKAKELLDEAPNYPVFLVPKGDLALRFGCDIWNYVEVAAMEKAQDYYRDAMMSSRTYDICCRYDIVSHYLAARDSYGGWHNPENKLWSGYSFTSQNGNRGYYEGELYYDMGNQTPLGWGQFHFSNGELQMGYYKNLKLNGKGLMLIPDKTGGFWMRIGEWKNGEFVRGVFIDNDGSKSYIGVNPDEYKFDD